MCKKGENEKRITLTDGRIKSCDECIQPFVQMLNDNGYQTTASCCGHKGLPKNIILKDGYDIGKELFFIEKFEDARMIDKLYMILHPSKNKWKNTIKRLIIGIILSI